MDLKNTKDAIWIFRKKKIGSEKASESTNTNSKESKIKENSEPASENKTQIFREQKDGKEEGEKKNSNQKKKPIFRGHIPIEAIREELRPNDSALTESITGTKRFTNLKENRIYEINGQLININQEPAPLEEKNKKKEENQQNYNQKINSVQKENDLKNKDKNILNIKNNKNNKNGDIKDKQLLYSDYENDNSIGRSYSYNENHLNKSETNKIYSLFNTQKEIEKIKNNFHKSSDNIKKNLIFL